MFTLYFVLSFRYIIRSVLINFSGASGENGFLLYSTMSISFISSKFIFIELLSFKISPSKSSESKLYFPKFHFLIIVLLYKIQELNKIISIIPNNFASGKKFKKGCKD